MGMVARLRQGKLHTYCIGDHRLAQVKDAWLDNTFFFTEDVLATENPRVTISKLF